MLWHTAEAKSMPYRIMGGPLIGGKGVEAFESNLVSDKPEEDTGIERVAGTDGTHGCNGCGLEVAGPLIAEEFGPGTAPGTDEVGAVETGYGRYRFSAVRSGETSC